MLPEMTFTFLRWKVNAQRFMILEKECYGRKEYNLFSHVLWALPELIDEFCIPFAIRIEFCGWLLALHSAGAYWVLNQDCKFLSF